MPAPSLMPCPTCELEFAWPPVERAGRAYCCDGCAAGGPCCCSYDDSPQPEVTMNAQSPTGGASAAPVRWIPMTAEAFSHLEAEADRLVAAVGDSQSTAWADGISGDLDAPTFVANGEFDLLVRRLEKLRGAIANAHVVRPDGRAVVGSRITVSDADGSLDTYVLVAPGEADPRAGHISPESPLGAALLERRAGDLVEIAAPAGTRRMAVVSVEQSKLGWSRRS